MGEGSTPAPACKSTLRLTRTRHWPYAPRPSMRRLLACLAAVAAVVAAPARGGAYPLRVPLVPSPFEIDATGKLEFLDVERADSAGPYQNPQAKLRLHLTTDFAH